MLTLRDIHKHFRWDNVEKQTNNNTTETSLQSGHPEVPGAHSLYNGPQSAWCPEHEINDDLLGPHEMYFSVFQN